MPLTEFILAKRGSVTVWLSRSYAAPELVGLLADADRLFGESNCQVIKDQRKIKVGRSTLSFSGKTYSIYIKRYNSFSLRYRLGSLLRRSGALRSLRGAEILSAAGIATAVPVAGVEDRRYGMLRRSFFVSEEIVGAKTADSYWLNDLQTRRGREGYRLRRGYLAALGAVFRSLHDRQIYHDDLKDANIMAVAGGSDKPVNFFLLDLEGVRHCARLSERRRVKNLVQLHRTLGKHLTRSQRLAFLKTYMSTSYDDRVLKRELVARVLRRAERVARRKSRGTGA